MRRPHGCSGTYHRRLTCCDLLRYLLRLAVLHPHITLLHTYPTQGGGIGGGGVLVPLYILVMGFHPRAAIPLANVTIFGGSIANCILNLPKRHPVADRPLIDFDLVMVMEPLTIAGAVVGAVINKLAPEWLITFCLVVTLAYTSRTTWLKGFKQYAKDQDKSLGPTKGEVITLTKG